MNTRENQKSNNENSAGTQLRNLPTLPRILGNNLPIRQLLKSTQSVAIQQKIGTTIAIIVADLGLKTIPDQLAQKRMIHYLLSYYQDLSFEEIIKAFELALVGKFSVNIEHYDSFDIKYLTKILNAYRDYKKINTPKLPTARTEEAKPPTEAEKRQTRIGFFKNLEKTYKTFQKTGNLDIIIHWLVYNKLLEYNIIHISENDWSILMDKATKLHKLRLNSPKTTTQKKEFTTILQNFEKLKFKYPFELSRIQNIAKEIAVIEFFQKLKRNNLNFHTIIVNSGAYE